MVENQIKTLLEDKNVILIGPAKCVETDLIGIDVDSYDLVVRLNWHWKVPESLKSLLGSRTDIIYHCFDIDQYSEDDIIYWEKNKTVVIARNDLKYMVKHKKDKLFPLIDKYKFKIYSVENKVLKNLTNRLNSNPNTGVLAIHHLLTNGVKSVSCVGFDFYQSSYLIKEASNITLRQYINSANFLNDVLNNSNHNPQKQFFKFSKFIKNEPRFIPIGKLKELLEFEWSQENKNWFSKWFKK